MVKRDDRPADIVAFEESVIEFFLDAATLLGIPKSVAAIYGVCFASPEPLSYSDINARLDISSGSISQGIRVLREVGALKTAQHERLKNDTEAKSTLDGAERRKSNTSAEEIRAGRATKDSNTRSGAVDPLSASHKLGMSTSQRATARYEPDLALRKLVLHWIEKRLYKHLTSGREQLDTIAQMVSTQSNPLLRDRLNALENWHGKARSVLPVVKTFLKLT